jgi:hypothetical protein
VELSDGKITEAPAAAATGILHHLLGSRFGTPLCFAMFSGIGLAVSWNITCAWEVNFTKLDSRPPRPSVQSWWRRASFTEKAAAEAKALELREQDGLQRQVKSVGEGEGKGREDRYVQGEAWKEETKVSAKDADPKNA